MENVFYAASARFNPIIDVVTEKGTALYSGKTAEELGKQYGVSIEVLPFDVATARAESRAFRDPVEITREQFKEMLEVLPPRKWTCTRAVEVFHMSERITYSVVSWFVRIGERCYTFCNTDKLSTQQAVEKVQAFIDSQKETAA